MKNLREFFGIVIGVTMFGFGPASAGSQTGVLAENDRPLGRLEGELGELPPGLASEPRIPVESTTDYRLPDEVTRLLHAAGNEVWRLRRWSEDEQGKRHYRMRQYIGGLEVVGGDIVVHTDTATGSIEMVDAQFLPSSNLPLAPITGAVRVSEAVALAYGKPLELSEEPRLSYFRTAAGKGHLVWRSRVKYRDEGGQPQIDDVFVDGITGDLVEKYPLVHSALGREIYSSGNTTSLPGTLLFGEGGSSTDAQATTAYNFAGSTYSYFSTVHGRDSWNGVGGLIKATVHFGAFGSVATDNAFWDSAQQLMAFGEGRPNVRGPYVNGLDVVAHEFTHGVDDAEAQLVYQNESGAIDESLADIFGAMTERFVAGGNPTVNTWRLGEEVAIDTETCFSGFINDAIRYMNDPSCDGFGRDYYPDRKLLTAGEQPSLANDWGWVHYNSGISNLAFYLLSQGGTHPRGKTTVAVPAIGYAKAERIFYNTHRDYLLSNDGFFAAGNKSESFAKTQYGPLSSELKSTCAAWQAVGVLHNRLNCPDANANLLPPATMSGSDPGDICYGVQDVSWSTVSGATSYQLRISANSSDYTHVGIYWSGSSTQTTVNMGFGSGRGYARVSACNANGCSALSSAGRTVRGTTTCP